MPKIQIVEDEKIIKKYGGTKMFFAPPIYYDELMKKVPKGKLYDEELCAGMTEEEYINSLREDILEFNSLGVVVSGYTVSASTDVEEFTVDGRECARLYATYRLRQVTEYIYSPRQLAPTVKLRAHYSTKQA